MNDPVSNRLEPSEVLRVMDVAQVIRARQERVEQGAFDRDATVREIQTLYEDLGDLVERDAIELALDEYRSERYAFTPPPKGLSTTLAWTYVRRSMLTRRIVAPTVVAGGLIWGAVAFAGYVEGRALDRDVGVLRSAVSSMQSTYGADEQLLRDLRRAPTVAALTEQDGLDFATRLSAAEERLGSAAAVIAEVSASNVFSDAAARGDESTAAVRAGITGKRDRLRAAGGLLAEAEVELEAARIVVGTQERLTGLIAEVPALEAAIRQASEEPGIAEEAARIAARADLQAASRDIGALEASISELRRTLASVEQEYRVEILGGVWRQSNDGPNVRNYYLRVRAMDAAGNVVARSVRNEETGRIETVREWGERVPKEVYDRVGADKQDNGLIDQPAFGTKRRGWLTIERLYPDVGQITNWSDA